MIEQVLYRRTVDQGYKNFSSKGLSDIEARKISNDLGSVASELDSVDTGSNAPFIIYSYSEEEKMCLAIFEKDFSGGRSNILYHGLLIPMDVYKNMTVKPETFWGFTYRNFLYRKTDSQNKMKSLAMFDVEEDSTFDKDKIFSMYNLANPGFANFLNLVYSALYKNKTYHFGIKKEKTGDANRAIRRLGYLIMSMLPFELRTQISFCSREVSGVKDVTIQMIGPNKEKSVDAFYSLDSGELTVNNKNMENIDFYPDCIMEMSDTQLRDYFETQDRLKKEICLSLNKADNYVITKLLRLSQNPEKFKEEQGDEQIRFIHDILELNVDDTEKLHKILVTLLLYVNDEYNKEDKLMLDTYTNLYEELFETDFSEMLGKKISDVLCHKTDAERVEYLFEHKNYTETQMSGLWCKIYNQIQDYTVVLNNQELFNDIREKYLTSENPQVRNLYPDYIDYLSISDIEELLGNILLNKFCTDKDCILMERALNRILREGIKINLNLLFGILRSLNEKNLRSYALYIRETYLQTSDDESIRIYDHLKEKQPVMYQSQDLNKEALPSFDHYCALALGKELMDHKDSLMEAVKYVNMLKYHDESFSRLFEIYSSHVEEKLTKTITDKDRYLYFEEIRSDKNEIWATKFGDEYKEQLLNGARNVFWKLSDADSFDFGLCSIYTKKSPLYAERFSFHENHILAEEVKDMIEGKVVNWNKVYEILFTERIIPDKKVRDNISRCFRKQYEIENLNKTDKDFLVFKNFDTKTLEMDYIALFGELQRQGYSIDEKDIISLSVFDYIKPEKKIHSLIKKYNKYKNNRHKEVSIISKILSVFRRYIFKQK